MSHLVLLSTISSVIQSGLGLLEYLQFIEDMEMQPIMAVWSGYSLNGQSIPEDGLAPYIQAAKDQVSTG